MKQVGRVPGQRLTNAEWRRRPFVGSSVSTEAADAVAADVLQSVASRSAVLDRALRRAYGLSDPGSPSLARVAPQRIGNFVGGTVSAEAASAVMVEAKLHDLGVSRALDAALRRAYGLPERSAR